MTSRNEVIAKLEQRVDDLTAKINQLAEFNIQMARIDRDLFVRLDKSVTYLEDKLIATFKK